MLFAILLAGCASSSTFGNKSESSSSDVSIYTDKFTLGKTYEYNKGLRGGFALSRDGLSADYLHLYPHLTVENDVCTPTLLLDYTGTSTNIMNSGADKVYKRFIFLSGNERFELQPKTEQDTETEYGYNSKHSASSYNLILTKAQFEILKDFFSTHEKVECAAYSTDNKVVTFATYNKKWHMNAFTAIENCVMNEYPNIKWNESNTNVIIK